MLRNEIGWFDVMDNTSSMLASRLESDATLLRTVVVDRSSILLQNVGLVVTSFIIAFILNWRLTLVVLAMYPLIVSGHISEVCSHCGSSAAINRKHIEHVTELLFLFQKLFMKGFGGDLGKAYLKANMFAGEAVSNIRTVAAFCSEEKVLDQYAHELVEPSNSSFYRGQVAGIFYGVAQFFIFSSYALALWYVAQLSSGGDIITPLQLSLLNHTSCISLFFEIFTQKWTSPCTSRILKLTQKVPGFYFLFVLNCNVGMVLF